MVGKFHELRERAQVVLEVADELRRQSIRLTAVAYDMERQAHEAAGNDAGAEHYGRLSEQYGAIARIGVQPC
jgi:hypothetical protein